MDLAAIREMLSRLADLTTDELTTLRGAIVDLFDGLEGTDPETVATMTELADALTGVKAEQVTRAEAEADAERQAQELRTRMADLMADDAEPDADADAEVPEVDADADAEPVEGADAVPVPVTASTSPLTSGRASRMARGSGTGRQAPSTAGINVHAPLVASGSARGPVAPGEAFTDRWALAETMSETLASMPRSGAPRGNVIIASARYDLPEERRLGADPEANARKIEAITGPQALVATGGVCLPVNVDYGVPTWSSADRPLKASLPAFQADRGGITFVTPPTMLSTAGATAVWTEANDVTPTAPAIKPVYRVACGTPVTTYVNAIPTRLEFGNMQGRFAPEQIAANTDLAIAQAARVAELELLTLMDAASTVITSAQWLGATRDLLATLDLAVAGYRYRNRIPQSTTLAAVFPEWVQSLMRADLVRQLAVADAPLGVPLSAISEWFTARNVNVTWTLDGRAAAVTGTTYPAQTFAAQAAGAINKWPNNAGAPAYVQIVWNLFVEGTMQFLDGGRLDLGIVRDSTLDATNDYETFVEPFEGLAFRGIEALTIVSNVSVTGASGATVAPLAAPIYYVPGN